MVFSKGTQEKISLLFKTNPEMMEKLLRCDAEAIREIGFLSQKGINPNDVVAAYESNDPEAVNVIYQQAKMLVELQELYKDLCLEYCNCFNENSSKGRK